jgi:hypothetical protein
MDRTSRTRRRARHIAGLAAAIALGALAALAQDLLAMQAEDRRALDRITNPTRRTADHDDPLVG